MNGVVKLIAGLGIGALLMYLFDPKGGGGRRALIRDKAVGLSNDIRDSVTAKTKDVTNRAKGFMHEAKAMIPESSNVAEHADRPA